MKPTDAKHTPGPWRACGWNNTVVNADAGTIVVCPGGGEGATLEEIKANAELIASAPALLAERDALRAERAEKQRQCDALKLALDAEVNKGVALRRALRELRSYADLKLQGHRQDYDEDHCMVQTALRMIALADDALR